MITILHVDVNDIAGCAKDVPFDRIRIEDLKTAAFHEALHADAVIFKANNREYILKDRR